MLGEEISKEVKEDYHEKQDPSILKFSCNDNGRLYWGV